MLILIHSITDEDSIASQFNYGYQALLIPHVATNGSATSETDFRLLFESVPKYFKMIFKYLKYIFGKQQ